MSLFDPAVDIVQQPAADVRLYQFDFSDVFPDVDLDGYEVVVTGATNAGQSRVGKLVSLYITGGKPNTIACMAIQVQATNNPTLSHTIYAYIKFV